MSREFEAWLKRSLDFLSERLSPARALEMLASLIRENPELYKEFMLDPRVQSVEVRSHQDDLLN